MSRMYDSWERLVAAVLNLGTLRSAKASAAISVHVSVLKMIPPLQLRVLNFKRSEVEFACEYFTNVIGSSSLGTLYKGTLSTGVEIAVAAIAFTSANDWSNSLEALFRDEVTFIETIND
ncbi:hypothetical protein ABFS82_06G141400 [Erythranthe guttata]